MEKFYASKQSDWQGDIANPKSGKISEVFGAGGGTQIKFGTSFEWYEKMGIIKEIK